MKKKILFLVLSGSLVGFSAISQQDETVYHNHKKKIFYSVKVTLINGEKVTGVLNHFSDDSLFVFPLESSRVIQPEAKFGIAATDINSLNLRKNKKIRAREMTNAEKIAKTLNDVGTAMTFVPTDPLGAALLVMVLPVVAVTAGIVHLGSIKHFKINGNKEKFGKMATVITGKHKSDSVANTTVKIPTGNVQ